MKFSNINFEKKIERKKFFTTVVVGIVTYAVLKSFPFNLFIKKKKNNKIENHKKNMIKENPLAVSRTNTGVNNG
ncbi:hypothetical protein LJE86_14680 [bacterium BMS3Abin03]|jgi:hypothetical protein|nr:hypothetical protein [bacterium BMS3Abin03]MCG6959265.1 hypothetical protein [bacterium BMS3Abin03]